MMEAYGYVVPLVDVQCCWCQKQGVQVANVPTFVCDVGEGGEQLRVLLGERTVENVRRISSASATVAQEGLQRMTNPLGNAMLPADV